MGNENSVVLHADQVSAITGESPTITSDPIELDRETFMDDLMKVVKYPVPPMVEATLKEVQVKEITELGDAPLQYDVKVLLDGPKLDQYHFLGVGKGDGTDMIMSWLKTSYNPETGVMFSRAYKGGYVGEVDVEQPTVLLETCLTATKDPFRFEYYVHTYEDGKKGPRVAGDEQIKLLKMYFTEPIRNQCERKAKLVLNEDGTAATSEPLDEFLSKEDLLQGWFECAMAQSKREEREITETMPNEQFFAATKITVQDTGEEKVNKVKVDLDLEEGTVTTEAMVDDDIIGTETFKATGPSPLTLTCTHEDKHGNKTIAKGWLSQCQAQLDATIKKASGGWFF